MKLNKKISFLLFLLFFLLLSAKSVLGMDSFVSVVNPVRGNELSDPGNPFFLEGVFKLLSPLDQNNIPATWLLRFDVFSEIKGIDYFNKLKTERPGDELGIFLEITPGLAKQAELGYPKGGLFWHDANKIFLSGFKPEERIKLIDVSFKIFKDNFGSYPKSVGAWHVDAYSALYMQEKYEVEAVLICADQFGTDGYQIWGGWWGVPYYPSKYNILMPAQTKKNKIDAVVFWWAARDPSLGYGGSVKESTYSVQVNDYISHGLDSDYFYKLMADYLFDSRNQFGQLTIGLENDNNWQKIGDGFNLQIEKVKQEIDKGSLRVLTMADFAKWYREKYINFSPDHRVGGWEMSTDFQTGLDNKGKVVDVRIYNEQWPEANFLTANPWETLSLNNPYKVDSVRFADLQIFTDIKQEIPFKNNSFLYLFFYIIVALVLIFFSRKNLTRLVLILFGSIGLFLPMVKSGLVYPFGMGFWGPNGHDGIWHLALINNLKNFSLENPVFSGVKLTNYHIGFDVLAAFLSKITTISPIVLYFQFLPLLMAVLIGILTYKFIEKWTGSKNSAWWATFFVYFGGSWGWIFNKGESAFWSNQSVSSLINPPYAFSLIILLLGLIKFMDFLKKPNKKNLILSCLLFGVLIQIKVYSGIMVIGSLACLSAWSLFFQKKDFKNISFLFLGSLLVAGLVFLPFNRSSSSLIVFSPLWFPHSMLAFADRFGWMKLENARSAYFNSGKWVKWLLAEGLAVSIFILGNLGTRMIGFFDDRFFWKKKKIELMELFLLSALIIVLIFPLLFVQKGNPWNTIQFFYYFQFLMAIWAGISVDKILKKIGNKKYLRTIFIFLLIILTLPTTYLTLKNNYLPARPPSRISIEELEALKYLKNLPRGIVLSYPFNSDWRYKFSEPKPLYAYETTAYIPALSGQNVFLADEMNLEITNFNWQERRSESQIFFLTADQSWGKQFLIENKIKYIYLVKGQKMNLGLNDIGAKKIFENGEVTLFAVK